MREAKTNGNRLMLAGTGAGTKNSPEDEIKALAYLQSIYRDPMEATPTRMRAAIECLPFENPKLSATAIATLDGKSFADALDRAIERSKSPPMLNAPTIELVDATEMKKPMSRLYRRY